MALFGEPRFDMSVRQKGFNRYRQLLSNFGVHWFQVNLFTVLGALPMATGITVAIVSSSVVLLIPCAFLGGMIFGPFLAGMVDAVMRGLRDDPENWWSNYKKSWKQNWKGSLIPGGILGLLVGMYAFMLRLFWVAQVSPTPGTVALYAFAGLLLIIINTLYWPQLVLFQQSTLARMRNIILFTAKYLWKMVKVSILQIIYMAFIVLFAPWTLILMPLLGFWYIIFLSQFLIYNPLNQELHIEEQFSAVTGWPIPEPEENLEDEEE